MKSYIITISREFGCGARQIAKDLADKLMIPFYDYELVSMAAKKVGVNAEMMRGVDEIVSRKQTKLFREFAFGSSTEFYSDEAVKAQASVIYELANKRESCIMFGRCSDYVLREYPNVINMFLYAPLKSRIKHISKTYELNDERVAEKLIQRVDKQRHNYYKYVTGQNRGNRLGKDILIDVNTYGKDGTIELMYEAVRIRFGLEKTESGGLQ